VPYELLLVQHQHFIHQCRQVDILSKFGLSGVGLLCRNDISDVTNGFIEPSRLRLVVAVLLLQDFVQAHQIVNQLWSPRIGSKELGGARRMFTKQRCRSIEPGNLRFVEPLAQQLDRTTGGVHGVADVVQHLGRHLRHPGSMRRVEDLFAGLGEVAHHAVEFAGQRTDFVRSGEVEARFEIAALSHLHRMRGHALQRVDNSPLQHNPHHRQRQPTAY